MAQAVSLIIPDYKNQPVLRSCCLTVKTYNAMPLYDNIGLSLFVSEPLQLYQKQSLDSSAGYMYTLWVQQDITDDDTLATFWLLFGYILAIFWLHSGYILATFRLNLATFWL